MSLVFVPSEENQKLSLLFTQGFALCFIHQQLAKTHSFLMYTQGLMSVIFVEEYLLARCGVIFELGVTRVMLKSIGRALIKLQWLA